MNLVSKLLFLASFFTYNYVNSQTISGFVLDSITYKPIEFANITYLKTNLGTNADIDGHYNLKLSDSKDKLQISSLGYENKIFDLSDFSQNKDYVFDFYLKQKTEILEEILVVNKKAVYTNSKNLGLNKKRKIKTGFPFGYEFCNLIKNPYSKKGKIKSITLSLSKTAVFDYMATYNIRFYEYNPENKMPGKEIYFENLIVQPENKTYNLKVDVESLKISFPKNGVCIGIEVINKNNTEKTNPMSIIAPGINFTFSEMEILTWSRYRNKTWNIATHKTPFAHTNDFVNAMIKIEVKIEK